MGRRSRRDNYFGLSLMDNTISYRRYFFRLMNLAITSIGYENLPDSVDPRFLEVTLFDSGQALYFDDEVMGNVVMQFATNGPLDIYRNPTVRRAYAVNGFQRILDGSESVIIWNNYLKESSYLYIDDFASKLALLDRVIMINVNAQKTPILLQGNENQRLTLMNLYKEYDGMSPVIFGDKNLDINSLKAVQTLAPLVAPQLYELKVDIWNEALTFLGIPNVSTQKKERLISDEVNRSMGGVIASGYSRLNARQEAFDKINKMFGTDIKVFFREFSEKEVSIDEQYYGKEDVEIEQVYD